MQLGLNCPVPIPSYSLALGGRAGKGTWMEVYKELGSEVGTYRTAETDCQLIDVVQQRELLEGKAQGAVM